ncbi:MAG TPA: GNVR domain-containing protein [Steroidobacteraceae bacterium]|jgi:succinoglycan biosynthesis transport protein ExoP|nr:GNVR domain-containing protein [Steroidobacteraceae bacterium]
MTLRQFLRALRARFGVFALALVVVVLATMVASLVIPKTYRATVSLLVDAKDEQSMGDALRALGLPQEHLSYLQTQADILASPKVARRAVQQLDLTHDPAAMASLGITRPAGERLDDQLVDGLLRHLKVDTSQSNIIEATVTSDDPRLAARLANAVAAAYVSTMLELRVAPTREAAAWFDEQLKGLRANVEQAQLRLRTERAAEQQRLAQQPERLPQARDDVFIQQLRADLLHGEAKLRQLSTQYGVNYPDYQRQLSENLELRASLQAELHKVAAGMADPELGQQQLTPSHAQAEHTMLVEPVLQQDVESAQHAYDTALQRYFSSQVDSRASQTNVAVLSAAAIPLRAFRPNLPLNAALALATGLALGCALVVILERADARVRCVEDLVAAVPQPLLGVLSDEVKRAGLLPRPSAPALRALPKPG